MKNILSILLLSTITTACSVRDSADPVYTPQIEHATTTLQASPVPSLHLRPGSRPTGLVKQGNRIVVNHPEGVWNAQVIHLQTQATQNLFPRGRRTNESPYTMSLSDAGNSCITALDVYQGKLLITPTGDHPHTRSSVAPAIQLPAGQQHLAAVKAGPFVLSTGVYEQGRYLLYSPENEEANYFLDYPSHPAYPELQETTKGVLYASSVLKVRPDHRAFVCADMYSGVIDICRIDGNRIERIQQHCFHYPKVYIKEETGGHPDVAYSRDNCFGFTDITVSGDRIYAIYSGKTYRQNSMHFQECQTLLLFDWAGNLLNTYAIDTPLTHVCYETEENAIYAIGYTPEAALVKIEIPL